MIMKNGRPNLVDFRDYNREQLLGWLAANVGGALMRKGTGIRRIDKRVKPGAKVPLTEEMLGALNDPDAQLTNKLMRQVIDDFDPRASSPRSSPSVPVSSLSFLVKIARRLHATPR
jgi:hypothetical protein